MMRAHTERRSAAFATISGEIRPKGPQIVAGSADRCAG